MRTSERLEKVKREERRGGRDQQEQSRKREERRRGRDQQEQSRKREVEIVKCGWMESR
jgi:hypothetical protein